MVYKFFDKTSSNCCVKIEVMPSERPLDVVTRQSAENLHKPIIGKLEKRKFYSSFKDKICDADLADMQLIHKFK